MCQLIDLTLTVWDTEENGIPFSINATHIVSLRPRGIKTEIQLLDKIIVVDDSIDEIKQKIRGDIV